MERKWKNRWATMAAGMSLFLSSHVWAAPESFLAINVSPGTTYQLSRSGDELTVVVRDNKLNLRPQLENVRSRLVTGALVLSGRARETIIRLSLAPGLEVSDQLSLNPSRIVIGLGHPEPKYRGPAPQAVALTALQQLDNILNGAEAGRPVADPEGSLLCLGSRVMYPAPLPEMPFKLEAWKPARPEFKDTTPGGVIQKALEKLDAGKGSEALADFKRFGRENGKSALLKDVNFFSIEAIFAAASPSRPSARLSAVEELRTANRIDPRNRFRARPTWLAGMAYLDLKYFHEASTMFRDLLAMTPADSPDRAHILLALGWADQQRFATEEALKELREAIPMVSEERQGEIVLMMASIMAQKGEYNHVLKLLDLMRERWPAPTRTLLFQVLDGEALYRLDRFPEARAEYQQVEKTLGPRTPKAYAFRIGECLIMENKLELARHYFLSPSTEQKSETRRWQESLQTLRLLQMDLLVDTTENRRIIDLEKLRRLRLDSPFAPVPEECLIEFIKYYVGRDNLPDALGVLRTFLSTNGNNSQRKAVVQRVWNRIKAKLEDDFKHERYLEMLGLYERAFPVVADEQVATPQTAYLIARAYLSLGLYDEAYRAVTEAFLVEGSTSNLSDTALLLLVEIQRRQGRFEEARRALAFVRGRTRDPKVLIQVALEDARLLEGEGKMAQAVEAYGRYAKLETDPVTRVKALTTAAALLANAQGCATALPALLEASRAAQALRTTEQRAATADAFYRLGECQFSLDKFAEVVPTLMTALSRQAEHPLATFARYALAKSFLELNRLKEAEIMFRALDSEKARNPDDTWVRMAGDAEAQFDWKKTISALN